MPAIAEKVKGIPRLVRWLALAVVLLLVGGGGFFAWRMYMHRQSPEYAFEQIAEAISAGRATSLAALVDFRTLSQDLAAKIYALRPQTPQLGASPEQSVSLLAEAIQRHLLANLTAKPDEAEPEKTDVYSPIVPLPHDFFRQLVQGLELHAHDRAFALLHAPLHHPRSEKDIDLLLSLEKVGGHWRVTRVANADELVQYFLDTETTVERQRDKALANTNLVEQKRMDAQLSVSACTASTHALSDGHTGLLLLSVTGFNKGQEVICNMHLLVRVRHGEEDNEYHINMAQHLPPGEHFNFSKQVEFDTQDPAYMQLRKANLLTCTASPTSMTLNRSGVLRLRHKRDIPPVQPTPAKK